MYKIINSLLIWQSRKEQANAKYRDWLTTYQNCVPEYLEVAEGYMRKFQRIGFYCSKRIDATKDQLLAYLAHEKTARLRDSAFTYNLPELCIYPGFIAEGIHLIGGDYDNGINRLTFELEIE